MPIRVKYDAPASVIGGASYLSGLGQFAQRQQELALQDMQQRRAIAAQAASQERGAMYDAAAQQRQYQQQAGLWQAEQAANERNAMLQRQWQQQDMAQQQFAQSEDDRRAWTLERYKNKEWRLDAAGRNKLHDISNRMTKLRMDPSLSQDEKLKGLQILDGEYWGVLDNPAPMIPGEEELTPDEKATGLKATVKFDDGTVVNGFLSERNGAPHFEPYEKPPDTTQAEMMKVEAEQRKAAHQLELQRKAAKVKADSDRIKLYDDMQMKLLEQRMKLSTELVPSVRPDGSVEMEPSSDPANVAPKPRMRLRTPQEVDGIMLPLESRMQMPNLMENEFNEPQDLAPSSGVETIISDILGLNDQDMQIPGYSVPGQQPGPNVNAAADHLRQNGLGTSTGFATQGQQQQPQQAQQQTQQSPQAQAMQAAMPAIDPRKLANPTPVPGPDGTAKLEHGEVIGPMMGADGQLHLWRWDKHNKAVVDIGLYNGPTTAAMGPDESDPSAGEPAPPPYTHLMQ